MDAMLDEHDWASEHVATAKDDIEEVFNFIAEHTNTEEDEEYDYRVKGIRPDYMADEDE